MTTLEAAGESLEAIASAGVDCHHRWSGKSNRGVAQPLVESLQGRRIDACVRCLE
jgi:hypothetical protein